MSRCCAYSEGKPEPHLLLFRVRIPLRGRHGRPRAGLCTFCTRDWPRLREVLRCSARAARRAPQRISGALHRAPQQVHRRSHLAARGGRCAPHHPPARAAPRAENLLLSFFSIRATYRPNPCRRQATVGVRCLRSPASGIRAGDLGSGSLPDRGSVPHQTPLVIGRYPTTEVPRDHLR